MKSSKTAAATKSDKPDKPEKPGPSTPNAPALTKPGDSVPKGAAALERAIKRQVYGAAHAATIHFPRGFGSTVQAEAERLLAVGLLQPQFKPELELTATGLHIGNIGWRDLLALASLMTTAREVLWTISHERAEGLGELKSRLHAISWELYLPPGTNLQLRVNSLASRVYHEGKIEELLAGELGRRGYQTSAKQPPPAHGEEAEGHEQKLDLRLAHNRLAVSLSLGGRPLYQRRYKALMVGTASVKEDIAAAAVQKAALYLTSQGFWGGAGPTQLVMPFAGSGTLGFEAYLHFAQVPPWVFFGPLAAAGWPCTPASTLRFIHKRSLTAVTSPGATQPPLPLTFIDTDGDACSALATNCASFNAGLAVQSLMPAECHVRREDFLRADWPGDATDRYFVGLNPPFGYRLGEKPDIDRLYPKLGKALQHGPRALAGFVFAPTVAVAGRLVAELTGFSHETTQFNHGGRTVSLICFARG